MLVKLDTNCHVLKITKSSYSNCSKLGMITSTITNKKPPRVLHASAKKYVELVFFGMYGHFAIQTVGDKIVETICKMMRDASKSSFSAGVKVLLIRATFWGSYPKYGQIATYCHTPLNHRVKFSWFYGAYC